MTQAYNLSQLANNLNTSGQLDATDGLVNAVPISNGGTGASNQTNARANLDVPSTSGLGASGTWNIAINGTAASADTVTSTINSDVTATTQASGDNSTKVATTAFVQNAIGIPVNVQTFNSTGVWTKPGAGQTMARIQVWGGGGGGGSYPNIYASTGAGGGYMELTVPLSYLSASANAVVGSGGAGLAGASNFTGNPGGASSFPLSTSVNGLTVVKATGGGTSTFLVEDTPYYLQNGGAPVNSNNTENRIAVDWNGGQGWQTAAYAEARAGAPSSYGGSAGSSPGYYAATVAGAMSLFGGQGGGIIVISTGGGYNFIAAVQPGGGGSSGSSPWAWGSSQSGAAGRVVVTCW